MSLLTLAAESQASLERGIRLLNLLAQPAAKYNPAQLRDPHTGEWIGANLPDLPGFDSFTSDEYDDEYGEEHDSYGIDIGPGEKLTARVFTDGTAHVVYERKTKDGTQYQPIVDGLNGDQLMEIDSAIDDVLGSDVDDHHEPDSDGVVYTADSDYIVDLNEDGMVVIGSIALSESEAREFGRALVETSKAADDVGERGEPVQIGDAAPRLWNRLRPLNAAEVHTAESSVSNRATRLLAVSRMPVQLRKYWITHEAWGKPGAFDACVKDLREHGVPGRMVEGACANLHKEATGRWPGEGHHNVLLAEFDEGKHKRDRRGRFAKTAGQMVSELDDLLARFETLAADLSDDDDDKWDIDEVKEKLTALRDRKQEKAKRREAAMDTGAYGEVEMQIHRDGDIGVDWTSGGFYAPPATMKEIVTGLDELRRQPLPAKGEVSRFTTEDEEFAAIRDDDGTVQLGPASEMDDDDWKNVLELQAPHADGSDEVAEFADLLEEMADRSLEGGPENAISRLSPVLPVLRPRFFAAAARTQARLDSRYDPTQKRDWDGEWSDGSFKDKLGIDRFNVIASGKVKTHEHSQYEFAGAVIDTPNGRQVRIGIVKNPKKWGASNADRQDKIDDLASQMEEIESRPDFDADEPGEAYEALSDQFQELEGNGDLTASLTPDAVAQLQAAVYGPIGEAIQFSDDFQEYWGQPEKQAMADEWETLAALVRKGSATDQQAARLAAIKADAQAEQEALGIWKTVREFGSGVIAGVDGYDLGWQVQSDDDGDGGWTLEFAIRPPDADAGWYPGSDGGDSTAQFAEGQTAKLDDFLDFMREAATSPGGG